ncbi:MAG: hypothetical protein D6732_22045 [Methanobacteriota archaeon]|nr:MAG: hypothetical protein D6732_22045 [Euryarchaeota archaeon]
MNTQIPANSLQTAINYFNELQPLIFNKEELKHADPSASPKFYLERPDNPLEEMKVNLINSTSDEKLLLTGHMGSGKSTELNRLAEDPQLQKHFFIVKYRIVEALNITDIDYLDFLMSFAAILFTRASEAHIEFEEPFLKKISRWIQFISGKVPEIQESQKSRDLKGKTLSFFKRIMTILLREVALRDALRQSAGRNITELLEVINSIIREIQTRLPKGKQLLVIIDDMEKIPDVNRADALFNQAGGYMIMPQCKIIYTLPIALYYNVKIKQILNTFSRAYFLKNITIFDENTKQLRSEQVDFMRGYIAKRMELSLMEPGAQDAAIESSGGVVRELMRIIKDSIIKALARQYPKVTEDLVKAVIIDLRNEYGRGLVGRHYRVLNTVIEGRENEVDDEKTLMELYHSRVLLEYENENGGRWIAVNPIVRPLLQQYRNKTYEDFE